MIFDDTHPHQSETKFHIITGTYKFEGILNKNDLLRSLLEDVLVLPRVKSH